MPPLLPTTLHRPLHRRDAVRIGVFSVGVCAIADFEARHADGWELHSQFFQLVLPRGGVCGWGGDAELCFFRPSVVSSRRCCYRGAVLDAAAHHHRQNGLASKSDPKPDSKHEH
jgi:hypothetical protein